MVNSKLSFVSVFNFSIPQLLVVSYHIYLKDKDSMLYMFSFIYEKTEVNGEILKSFMKSNHHNSHLIHNSKHTIKA